MRHSLKTLLFLILAACLVPAAMAQQDSLHITVSNGVVTATPIVVVPFHQETIGPPPSTDVAKVIRMDLARSGRFRTLDRSDIVQFPSRGDEIQFPTWKQLNQDYIVVGHIKDAGNGEYEVGYELWNVNTKQHMLIDSITGSAGKLRGMAHQIADKIYKAITGVRGAFYTRMAYITAVGTGKKTRYSLWVADSDGHNPIRVVSSREALLSPAWSPDGKELAYVSFESGDSAIYIQNLATGARRLVSGRKGINGAPSFSPDGTKLAVSLSYVGNPEIFIIDLASGKLTRLTHNYAIDTEPTWTSNGKNIVFTSDRSGKPQLYEMSADGGTPTRVTFQGAYNAEASVSYDGKEIAMVQGNGNVYRIAVMDRSLDGQEHFVSPGDFDESPSFAPNGSMLLYAATEGLRGVLYAVSEDGKVRQRLVLAHGDVREPSWGPYRKP
jgi:TolB protein